MYRQEVLGKILRFREGYFRDVWSEANVHHRWKLDLEEWVICGVDWGDVNPHAVMMQPMLLRSEDGKHQERVWVVFQEVYLLNSNDDALIDELFHRLLTPRPNTMQGVPGHPKKVLFAPDPRGRKQAYALQDECDRRAKDLHGIVISRIPQIYDSTMDGMGLIQRLICNAAGERRLLLTTTMASKKALHRDDRPLMASIREAAFKDGRINDKRWKHGLDALHYALVQGELVGLENLISND